MVVRDGFITPAAEHAEGDDVVCIWVKDETGRIGIDKKKGRPAGRPLAFAPMR